MQPLIPPKAIACVRLTMLLAAVATPASAAPDGFIDSLPQDGAWVEYEERGTFSAPALGFAPFVLRISSVGTVRCNDVNYRWIELKLSGGNGRAKVRQIVKLLIAEEHLKNGVDLKKHFVRGWYMDVAVPDYASLCPIEEKEMMIPLARIVFPGCLREKSVLPETFIRTRIGNMACTGITGTTQMTIQGLNGRYRIACKYWLNSEEHFGVTAADLSIAERMENDAEVFENPIVVKFRSIATGTGATSEYPDAK